MKFRPAAIPLITVDPFFSVWSCSDALYSRPTEHWSGKLCPIEAGVYVGNNYYAVAGFNPNGSLIRSRIYQRDVKITPTSTIYEFENELLDIPNYQGNAAVNYTDKETPWTRIIEHKWFEFGTQSKTVISREYSSEWRKGDEPYYPVNDARNGSLYQQYKALADGEKNIIFGGRLGEYKYYDMDAVIASALALSQAEL